MTGDNGRLISWNIKFMGGKWGRDLGEQPPSVDNIRLEDNLISWDIFHDEILRFDVCIKKIDDNCRDRDWVSIEKDMGLIK